MTQNIRYSVDSDGIAILLIDVADRPMNVITPGFRNDLAECVEKVPLYFRYKPFRRG